MLHASVEFFIYKYITADLKTIDIKQPHEEYSRCKLRYFESFGMVARLLYEVREC
jgi:hypothetical protein